MDSNLFEHSRLLWTPQEPSRTRVDVLRRAINHKRGLHLKDFHELHEYSVSDYAFWVDLWEFLGIISSVPPNPARVVAPGRELYLPKWFPETRLNYAENLLARQDDGIAITYGREGACRRNDVVHITWRELRRRVGSIAASLRSAGLQPGDRVASILTNSPNAIEVALATSSIGGVLSPTAPDMGVSGVLDRYRQIRPRILIAETCQRYAGKHIDLIPKWSEVVKELLKYGLETVVFVPGVGELDRKFDIPKSMPYERFLALGSQRRGLLEFAQLPFDHPLYILFSSGTSGPPKCIVHSAGGVLLQNMKDCAINFGMGKDDTYFQFTTTGWMMWPFMLSALGNGTRIIAYDGSPFHPDVRGFLKFIDEQRVSVWGTSPRFLHEIQTQELSPNTLAPFDSLRMIFSTGSVLTSQQFEWTQTAFNPTVHIASSSGGTDICGGFVTCVETLPVHAGEIQGKALGMKVEIFDPSGRNIEHTGTPGELVCTRPHPSLPISFWGDDNDEKLRRAYFDMYPGVWRQGDFIVLNPHTKGLIILGRSDGVLNPSGVRFGSAEIYAVIESPPVPYNFSHSISDSLCIGQRRARDKDERVLLFLRMHKGHFLTEDLKHDIRTAIRKALSPRHVPSYIFEVSDIPYTVNNKKIEIAIKQIVSSGKPLTPSGTVANPESFQEYYKFYEMESLIDKAESSSVDGATNRAGLDSGNQEVTGGDKVVGIKAKL